MSETSSLSFVGVVPISKVQSNQESGSGQITFWNLCIILFPCWEDPGRFMERMVFSVESYSFVMGTKDWQLEDSNNSWHLLRVYFVPSTVLKTLYGLSHWIPQLFDGMLVLIL